MIDTVVPRDITKQHWIETTNPALEGRLATQFALSNGTLGLRGTHEEMPGWASPGFYLAGTYCAAPQALIPIHTPDHILTHPERVKPEHHADYTTLNTMVNLPNPVAVRLSVGGEAIGFEQNLVLACERLLEMETATLSRRLVVRDGAGRRSIIDSERFVSWAHPRLVCFRYVVTAEHDAPVAVAPYLNTAVTNGRGFRLFTVDAETSVPGLNTVTVTTTAPGHTVHIAQVYRTTTDGVTTTLDVAIAVGPDADAEAQAALAAGYDAARAAHVAAVEAAQARAGAGFIADGLSMQGFRFAQMHLEMALCQDNPLVGVPIKGLTGEGYRFMVFWDTDFHMFPYYLLTNPAQAKYHILYRHNLLDAARENARAWGYRGAQVPWETGTTGEEETAPWLNLQERELHISADAAYAVKLYDDLADDPDLLVTHGAEIVFETARFFASRVTWTGARYELLDIGCPDQYHTFADNNIFISRMAQWNLRYAAELAADPRLAAVRTKLGLTDAEVAEFTQIADGFYIIQPNAEGVIEEFDGFFTRGTDLRGISETFCEHSQAVKQPDVLCCFIPFADDYSEAVQQANWRYYAARTMHGSSLSLPGMALAGAQCGLLDEAWSYFQRAGRMDLDDLNQNTNLGVHLAGYAVMWATLVRGFGGLTPRRDGVEITPRLPDGWRELHYTAHWRGCRVSVTLTHAALTVVADPANPRAVPLTAVGEAATLAPGARVVVALTPRA